MKEQSIKIEEYKEKLEVSMLTDAEGFIDESPVTPVENELIKKDKYQTTEKKFIICSDTLGQENGFNQDEKMYIINKMKLFKKYWEESEELKLNKCIDYFLQQEED